MWRELTATRAPSSRNLHTVVSPLLCGVCLTNFLDRYPCRTQADHPYRVEPVPGSQQLVAFTRTY